MSVRKLCKAAPGTIVVGQAALKRADNLIAHYALLGFEVIGQVVLGRRGTPFVTRRNVKGAFTW